jgi:hypothetical protein
MDTMTGVVDAVRKDRKGLCINDVWYSSWDPISVNRGDEVLFNFVKKGQYNNIKGKVRVTGKGTAPASSPRSSGGYSNIGVEIGHASNLAMRTIEQMLNCGDEVPDAGSSEYYKLFAERTIEIYTLMKGIRAKVDGKSEDSDVKADANAANKTEEEDDLF